MASEKTCNFTDQTPFKFMPQNLTWAVVSVSIHRKQEDFSTLSDIDKTSASCPNNGKTLAYQGLSDTAAKNHCPVS